MVFEPLVQVDPAGLGAAVPSWTGWYPAREAGGLVAGEQEMRLVGDSRERHI